MCTKGPECKIQRFGPGGCKVPICGQICGNTDTLEIANEFNRAYEAKIRLIEQEKGPDLQQDKLKLQREWIEDLREQNKMLACAIQELEYEAAHRVLCLEEKLKESAKCICEVMKKYREHDVASDLLSEPLQRIFDLENDQNELIELIRRGKDENNWSYHDLRFLTINPSELFGTSEYEEPEKFAPDGQSLDSKVREQLCQRDAEFQASLKEYQRSNKCVADLEQKLKYYMSLGNVEVVYEDLKRAKTEYDTLKRQMEDMRQALTEEVASKHDLILAMKRDCQQLEERCLQADKQTAFKDDIIKELRKEIKQLKQQINAEEIHMLHSTIEEIRCNLKKAMDIQEEKDRAYQHDVDKLNDVIKDLKNQLKCEATRSNNSEIQTEENQGAICNPGAICNRDTNDCQSQTDVNRDPICKRQLSDCHAQTEVNRGVICNPGAICNRDTNDCQAQTEVSRETICNQEIIKNKEDIIKIQNDTFNIMKVELQMLKKQEDELLMQREHYLAETKELKRRIQELECGLKISQERASNLQTAVDLYLNSINVLEVSEEKHKLEIEQQKMTINNLQEALVSSKHNLDELKLKTEETVSVGWAARWFGSTESKPPNKSVHDV